ncbi:MAG: glycosyltransferase family 2 protein [Candidatus Wallbacteria bacterium]|nr:glycosyltransferase family 2 protein [Candidatus Wallbacteria bacterium]
MKLSIIIPVFNEVRTIEEVVRRAASSPVEMDREIIVVDDGSTDGTAELLHGLEPTLPNGNGTRVLVRYATANAGKGSAIRMGLQAATGDIILFQDADLELDPAEYPKLLEPILAGRSRVVYGRRNYWSVAGSHWTSRVANGVLALLTSVLYGQVVVDMETAYKVMRRDAIAPLKLAARGFEIEPELTAKLRRAGEHILEVPIDYRPRTVAEGKKMRWKDGFIAVKTLLACRVAPLSDCVERSTPTAPRGLLTWGRLAAGGLVLALVLLGLFLGISHAFQGSRRLGEPTFSRGSGSRQADVQMDVLTLARDGSCRWQRRLTIDNASTSTVVEVLSNFPVLACSPFVVTDEADRILRSSARLESRGLRLFVNPTPPIATGQTRRLTIETLVRGLLRTPYDSSGRPRLELRVRQFVSHGAKSSLLLRLPEGVEPAQVAPAGLPWDLLARTPGGLTVCWNDLSSHVADELVGVSLDLGSTGTVLPANIPAAPSTLLAAATLVFLAALSVLWVAWRGPPRLHEPALLLAMAIQFFLFFQPMLLEDNMSYLAYVRSWWFDGDLDMLNDYKLHNSYGIYSPNPLEPVGPTGASVLLAPFFLLGVALRNALAAAGWSYPANGFSWPYVAAVGAGSFLYVTWGLLLTYRMVRETVGPRLALASTLAVGFGTNLMLVTSFWDASTHAPSFFLVTAFLRLWWTTRLDRSASGWTLLGLLGGLAVQTRYQNFPFLALPLMDSAWLVWSERGAQARHRLGIAALYGYAGGALLGLSAQLLLWTLLEGRPFVDNYGVTKDRFGRTLSRFVGLLFGRKSFGDTDGIFVTMPLLAPAWLALLLGWTRLGARERWLALMLAAQLAIVSSYEVYWGKLLYGSVYLANCAAITALGLARALQWVARDLGYRKLALAALVLACLGNMRFMIKQQAFEQMPRPENTSTAEKLRHLWFLSPAIEPGHLRLNSGEFGAPVRELLCRGGDAVPMAAVSGAVALGAVAPLLLPGGLPARGIVWLLGAYLGAVDWSWSAAARVPRVKTWSRISSVGHSAVLDYRPLSRRTGPRPLGPPDKSTYERVQFVSHLLGAEGIENGEPVADIVLELEGGGTEKVTLRAGEDTAEGAALRPETRGSVRHNLPFEQIAHQWRTRDGSANYYWAYSFVREHKLASPAMVTKLEVLPLLREGFVVVPLVLLAGGRGRADAVPGNERPDGRSGEHAAPAGAGH